MGVFLVCVGLLGLFLGSLCVLRPIPVLRIGSRRRGAAVLGFGAALATLGATLPAPLQECTSSQMRLDDFVPAYQFNEVHQKRVHAGPDRVFDAIKAVTPEEIRFYRTLTWIRSPRFSSGGRESLLNAAPSKPILDAATASGFLLLADVPGRELVLGTRPGVLKIAINFLVEDQGNGWSRVRTETRVFAATPRARRVFAVYWRLIYPGSALIRRMWLEAIARRAEGPGDKADRPGACARLRFVLTGGGGVRSLALLAALGLAAPALAGTVTGKVELVEKGGRKASDLSDVVLYIEGPKAKPKPVRAAMVMKGKAFTPRVVVVGVGSTVEFPNEDPVFHNVFSLSGDNRFDLDLYKRPKSGSWTFQQPGIVNVYCNIHPQMSAVVLVRDTPYFTKAAPDGSFAIEDVPAGRYAILAWQERAGEATREVVVPAQGEVAVQFALDASSYKRVPHTNKFGKAYSSGPQY